MLAFLRSIQPDTTQQDDAPSDNQSRVIWAMAFFSGLTLLLVTLRLVSRWMQWTRLAWDDVLLLAATTQMLATNILFVIAIKHGGLGRHITDVSEAQLVFFKKSYLVAGLVMPTCYATAKLSMLCLLCTIFAHTNFRKVVRVLTVTVLCWWMGTMLLNMLICHPINARWNPRVKGVCSEKLLQIVYFATPIPWIITDFAILIAPLPALWGIKTSRARQIGLTALFGFGIATCGVAIKRYITLLDIDTEDLTYSMVEPCIWTIIESSTTICCAALPASTFALRKILPLSTIRRFVEFVERRLYSLKQKSTEWRSRVRGGIHGPQEWRNPGPGGIHVPQLAMGTRPPDSATVKVEITVV